MDDILTSEYINELECDAIKDLECIRKLNRKGILASLMSTNIINVNLIQNKSSTYLDQGKTGYCWLVSVLFCISQYVKNRFGTLFPMYSKTYLIFYDKLEKANKFLTFIINYVSKPLDNRIVNYLLSNAMTDKGQWSMAENIITKYGLIPYEAMPDYTSEISIGELNACISFVLRSYSISIRQIYLENKNSLWLLQKEKKEALLRIYKLLVIFLGLPPKSIDVPKEYMSGTSKMSPVMFYKTYIDFPFDDYISICNIGKENYINYAIEIDGNVVGGKKNTFFNLFGDEFNQAVLKQISSEHFCWFTCDSGKFNLINNFLFDDEIFDLSIIIGNDRYKRFSRTEVYQYHIATLTHAMVFSDEFYHEKKRYLIAYNSSLNSKSNTFCYISDSWFNKYVFQAIVNKQYLDSEIVIKSKNQKSIMPWEFF